MKDFGSDYKNIKWIVLSIVLASPIALYTPLAIPFIAGTILMYFGASQYRTYKNVASWIQVPAKLLNTDIGVFHITEQGAPPTAYYFPLAHYSYSYLDGKYENNVYAYDKNSIWSEKKEVAEGVMLKLRENKNFTLYINPKIPTQSAVNISVSKRRLSQTHALLVAGILIITLGIYLCLLFNT